MNDQLVLLGKIAGIAGITVGALVLIFRSIIHKSFLSKMTQEQSFKITKSIISIAGVLAFAGLASWIFLKVSGNEDDKLRLVLKGTVKDVESNNLQNIKVILKLGSQILAEGPTDSEGSFSISHLGFGTAEAMLEVSGQGYLPFTKNLELNYAEGTKNLGELKLRSSNPEDNKPIVNAPSQATPGSGNTQFGGSLVQSEKESDVSQSNEGLITINAGEYGSILSQFNGAAQINLRIGGYEYSLTNSNLQIPFSSPGMIDYQIMGYTVLNGETICTNNSVGQVELADGAMYYLFENMDNTATSDCNWYLFNEVTFQQHKATLQQNLMQLFQGGGW